MIGQVIIIRNSAEMLGVLVLLCAVFFIYKLMKKDKGTRWNYILIAVCFLAISVCFSVIGNYFMNGLFDILKQISMVSSGLIFLSVLSSTKSQSRVKVRKWIL